MIKGSKAQQVDTVRQQIRDFKESSGVDQVIVLWTANTERYAQVSSSPAFWDSTYIQFVTFKIVKAPFAYEHTFVVSIQLAAKWSDTSVDGYVRELQL